MVENDLEAICSEIYDYPIPLERINENTVMAFLDRGPSASFKDFAARFMAKIMEFYNEKNKTPIKSKIELEIYFSRNVFFKSKK